MTLCLTKERMTAASVHLLFLFINLGYKMCAKEGEDERDVLHDTHHM